MAPRILVVDDNPELRDLISDVLKAQGFTALLAGTLSEAEELLRTGVDLVVLDYFVAGFSGEKFFERLMADPKTSGIPVLICSGSADIATLETLVQKGAAGYFRKPFQTDTFVAKVRNLLK